MLSCNAPSHKGRWGGALCDNTGLENFLDMDIFCDTFRKTLRPFPHDTPPIAILFSSVEKTYVFAGYHTSCFWFEFHLQQLVHLILFLFLCEVQDSEKQNLPKTRFGDLSEMLLRF